MRPILTILAVFINSCWLFSQRPGTQTGTARQLPVYSFSTNSGILSAEDCGNALDDDGDGLKDCEDYECYFMPSNTTCNCTPGHTIWMVTEDGLLYWVNVQTKEERLAGTLPGAWLDVTWTPDGKLYGIFFYPDHVVIYEINPATAQITHKANLPDNYIYANAMTSDKDGNLIIAAEERSSNGSKIIKWNIATGQISVLADLSGTGLGSGGDLAFSGGMLYLACGGNCIARINVHTGTFTRFDISGLPANSAEVYGLVSTADGNLFLSENNWLYKLDPATMQASVVYAPSGFAGQIWGMANYNDYCNAPVCKAGVTIKRDTGPLCSATGIVLKAEGSGVNGAAAFKWTLPDNSSKEEQTISATQSGWYKVRYYNIQDSCGKEDSVYIKTEDCICSLFVPNAFTPDNNGKNDLFRVRASCIITGELTIYNRWGNTVFRTKDLSKGWDGTINGMPQPNETFIYTLKYRLPNGSKDEFKKGVFVLFR